MSLRTGLITVGLVGVLSCGLAGCESSDARIGVDISVRVDGGLEIELQAPGAILTESQSMLEGDGWAVKSGASSWRASRSFADLAEYDEHDDLIVEALLGSYESDMGYVPEVSSPMELAIITQDLVLAKRYEVTLTPPEVDTVPTVCTDCGGDGGSDCIACGGDGRVPCTECGGDGTVESPYSIRKCYTCDGYGVRECYECDGDGRLECDTCVGSGEPTQYAADVAADAVERAEVSVAIHMPGALASGGSGEPKWSLDGTDVSGHEALVATSWVFNWLYAGIAAMVLLLIVATAGFFGYRKVARSMAAYTARRRAPMSADASATVHGVQQTGPDSAFEVDSGDGAEARFCRHCGTRNRAEAVFCSGCGAQV